MTRRVQPAARVWARETIADLNARASFYEPHPTLPGLWRACDRDGQLLVVLDEQTLFALNGWTRSPQAVRDDVEKFGFGPAEIDVGAPLPGESLVLGTRREMSQSRRVLWAVMGIVAALVIGTGVVFWAARYVAP